MAVGGDVAVGVAVGGSVGVGVAAGGCVGCSVAPGGFVAPAGCFVGVAVGLGAVAETPGEGEASGKELGVAAARDGAAGAPCPPPSSGEAAGDEAATEDADTEGPGDTTGEEVDAAEVEPPSSLIK